MAIKRRLIALVILLCTAASALAQTSITLPIAANVVADLGNGPVKARLVSGNASIFTSQGSGTGSTSGSSTTLTLTATPTTPPIVGGFISGNGITSGTTVAAYNGTTTITLSAAMTVPGGTTVSWGAACPSSSSGIPSAYIQGSVSAGYYIMYTQARVCAISPGGPVNTLLIEPVFQDQTGSGGGVVTPAAATAADDTNVTLTLTGTPATALLQAVQWQMGWVGTLAAGRLNSNVVQGITNDTNVTGTIAAQVLTLGWTGTLAAGRLNSNVVQGVTNDTNITGSIASQTLTLGWTGTLAIGRGGTGASTAVTALQNLSALANGVTTSGTATLGSGNVGKMTTNTGSGQTFTLPAPGSFTSQTFIIRNVQSGTLTVTAGSGAIFGYGFWNVSSISLNVIGSTIGLISDGSNWSVLFDTPDLSSNTLTIASGTITLGTTAIASLACSSVQTATATGTLTTDTINADFNADPTGTTGYTPSAMLTIVKYPTTNTVNFKQCNLTSSSITPSAVTLNWSVKR